MANATGIRYGAPRLFEPFVAGSLNSRKPGRLITQRHYNETVVRAFHYTLLHNKRHMKKFAVAAEQG
ncbi:hypothetical protein [Oryza sativa Japonica Group]|uniref:Uncharacterized protein n=1 Tax=Oryza sativa subsp. japonica TaxID=39947 RepID=Q5SN45_ORYSJ|nr:hypothetical protein [Oryza sativa Japonica Group]